MYAKDIQTFIDHLDELPTFKPVVARLIQVAADKETGIRDVSELLETDQSLSAKVLKIANSAVFAQSTSVDTVNRAAALLGKDLLLGLIVSAAVFDSLRPSAPARFDLHEFWNHCLACAIASQSLAERLDYPNPTEAFVAGLLHDLGKLVLACWNSEAYDKAVEEAGRKQIRLLECEESRFGMGHTAVARLVMERWRFPANLTEAAWLHHQPMSFFSDSSSGRLPFIVKSANCLCHRFRIGDSGNPVESWDLGRLSQATGIPEEELKEDSGRILVRFQQTAGLFDWNTNAEELYLSAVMRANRELADAQAKLAVANRRMGCQQKVLEALMQLYSSLDAPLSMTQGMSRMLSIVGDAFFCRKALIYVLVRRLSRIEGSLMEGPEREPRPFTLKLEGRSLDAFAGLRPRAQLSFLQATLKGGSGPGIQDGRAISDIFRSPETLSHILPSRKGPIGQILVEPASDDSAAEEFEEILPGLARGMGMALHGLMLEDELRDQSEELARSGRRVEQAERQLFHKERLASVGRLAAGAAHEVNNPLTIISGHAQLLLSELEPGKAKRRLEEINRQVERISDITSNLMGLARPAEPQVEPIRLKPILERTLAPLEQRMKLANINLSRNLLPTPPILGDPKQLEQVFLNLAINAIQAMKEGGRLGVTLKPASEGKEVQIDFADSGVGIPPADLRSIFDPFFTTKGEGEGTGLGLAICHTIVRNHGGRILVSSQQGQGSTFRIFVPAANERTQPSGSQRAETPTAPVTSTASRPASLLVVDDEAGIRDFLGQALSQKSLEVDFAEDGQEALDMLPSKNYDLVLLDLRMPKKAGMEVLKLIKEAMPELPVVVISGVAHESEFRAARQAGAFACLRKPFRLNQLLETIQQAVVAYPAA